MNRFPYQSLAYPLPQESELVRPETWARLPEIPIPRPRLTPEFYALGISNAQAPETVSTDRWDGYQPTHLFARRQFRREQFVLTVDLQSFIAPPERAWSPNLPDFARGRPPIEPQSGVFLEPPTIHLDVTHWGGSKPDYLHRRKPRQQGLYAAPMLSTVYETPPLLVWQGPLPEFARKHKPRPHGDRTAITEPSVFTATTLDMWRGEQPARLNRVKPRISGVFGHITEPTFYVEPPVDTWFVHRPEFAPGPHKRPSGDRTSITEPTLLQDVVPSAEGWRGERPDFARGHAPRPQGERVNIGPPDLQTTPIVCAWQGYQQPIVNRKKPGPVTSYTAPVESSLLFVAHVCTWYVEPVIVRARESRAHLPMAGVGTTYVANSTLDRGPWIIDRQTVFVPGDDRRVVYAAGDDRREVFSAGDDRRQVKPVEGL